MFLIAAVSVNGRMERKMIQVSNESDFRRALSQRESLIEITSDFSFTSQVQITYTVTIRSAAGSTFTLTRGGSYFSYLIRVAGGSLTLENIVIDGDSAAHPIDNETNRSLLFVTGGSLILGDGSVLQNNNAFREGGGVYLSGSTSYSNTLVMKGNAAITGCYSASNGGGIMFASRHPDDSIIITDDALLAGNTAPNGGGVYLRSYDESTGISVTIDGKAQITNNSVTGNGGGLYFSGFRNHGPLARLTIADGVSISGNQALNGGGLYFFGASDGDQLQIQPQVVISQNTASQNGGGIIVTASVGQVNLDLLGVQVSDNIAGTGGGLYFLADAGAAVSIVNTEIKGNKAVGEISGSGGGIWMQNRASSIPFTLTLENSMISANTAALQGGAMALWGGSGGFHFDARSNIINANTAATNGGGLLLSSSEAAELIFQGNTISQNAGGNSGGGIYYANLSDAASSRLEFSGDTIAENTAGAEGGGIRLTASYGLLEGSLTDCTISGNTAQNSNGGGIWAGGTGSSLVLRGNTLVTENASEGRNGGGIYFNSTAGRLMLIDQVQVSANRAAVRGGGICTFQGSVHLAGQVEIAYNTAQDYGGGISASEGAPVVMESGRIHDNTALQQGGGFWNRGGGIFTMTGGAIYGNHAKIGGGIYNDETSTIRIIGDALIGSPAPNSADAYAPGIYNDGLLYTSGVRNIANGLYLTEQRAAVRIEGPLEAGSVIQLNNSDYISANPEGNPIVVGIVSAPYSSLVESDADAFRKPPEGFDGWEIRLSEDHTQVLLAPILVNYIVTFKANDGWCCPKACLIPKPITVQSGGSMMIPIQAPTRRCYRFIGWSTAANSCGVLYEPGDTISDIREDIRLYAIWKRCCF